MVSFKIQCFSTAENEKKGRKMKKETKKAPENLPTLFDNG